MALRNMYPLAVLALDQAGKADGVAIAPCSPVAAPLAEMAAHPDPFVRIENDRASITEAGKHRH